MLTGRAYSVLAGAALLWVGSRFVGSADLHMVSVGILVLVPLAALLVGVRRQSIGATRRLSARRVFPGTAVQVELEVHNPTGRRSSVLLLEDRLPRTLGAAARLVVPPVAPGGRRTGSYRFTPWHRGRYRIGPLTASLTDPFDLARRRIEFSDRHDVVVYPAVEELGSPRAAAPAGGAGDSSSRQLFRSGEDFYTMRPYEIGDDLRRIHWPSTARTGELMIRQDEVARRASAALFVDTRWTGLGGDRDGFERAVSAAASIGMHYLRAGYRLRVATPERSATEVEAEQFLETLAVVEPTRVRQIAPALRRLRSASGGGSLVAVIHLPRTEEIAELSRVGVGAGFGERVAVIVRFRDGDGGRDPFDPGLEASSASLRHAGWDVLALRPSDRMADVWRRRARRPARGIPASS